MQTELPFEIKHHAQYNLSHGFLPTSDPIKTLSSAFQVWEQCVRELPKLFLTDQLRNHILSLPDFSIHELKTEAEFERAMMMLSYLGHAYVWHFAKPVEHLPVKLAKPWVAVANHIGRPPVLSYASYALYNW
jgi:indoleamine 2,3-dioxygenase